MSWLTFISLVAVGYFAYKVGKNTTTDKVISADNVLRGVKNGWYKAELTTDGKVTLTGYDSNGIPTEVTYDITASDYETLKNNGINVAE